MVAFNRNEGPLRERIAALEAKVQALQCEEERTTIALAAGEVGVFDWDLKHRRIYLSPILQDLLGYAGEELPANLDQWLDCVDGSDRFRVQSEMREALMYGRENFEAIYQLRRRDGATRQFLFRAAIMRAGRAEGGEAIRIFGTAIDVTTLTSRITGD